MVVVLLSQEAEQTNGSIRDFVKQLIWKSFYSEKSVMVGSERLDGFRLNRMY